MAARCTPCCYPVAEPVTDAEKAALAFIFAAVVLYVVSSRQKQNPAS